MLYTHISCVPLLPGVPNDTVFETQTRKEISKVMFHPLQQLPKKIWGGE
jgi:hypothetical protein